MIRIIIMIDNYYSFDYLPIAICDIISALPLLWDIAVWTVSTGSKKMFALHTSNQIISSTKNHFTEIKQRHFANFPPNKHMHKIR